MQFSTSYENRIAEIVDLFTATFTASEGAEEGVMIEGLVRNLLTQTNPDDIFVFTATEGEALIGGAIFTRLVYANDPRTVFLLSPMAVATVQQGQGIGQALLRHALAELRSAGIDVAITYGDPNFYGKVGFKPVSEDIAPAPLPLSQPQGWIAQSLTSDDFTPLRGPSTCVSALNDPSFW